MLSPSVRKYERMGRIGPEKFQKSEFVPFASGVSKMRHRSLNTFNA